MRIAHVNFKILKSNITSTNIYSNLKLKTGLYCNVCKCIVCIIVYNIYVVCIVYCIFYSLIHVIYIDILKSLSSLMVTFDLKSQLTGQ